MKLLIFLGLFPLGLVWNDLLNDHITTGTKVLMVVGLTCIIFGLCDGQ